MLVILSKNRAPRKQATLAQKDEVRGEKKKLHNEKVRDL